jgi:hypothetical protein
MIAQDARWIGDALLSASNFPASASAISLALLGHSSRIVYEGGRFVRKDKTFPELTGLSDLLPSEFAAVIQRARHATKLLDDNKKSIDDLGRELKAWLAVHRAEFFGNSYRLFRFLESDIGLFRSGGRLMLATLPVQFRLGAEPGIRLEALGPFVHDLAVEHGASLSVLAAVAGDASLISPRQDYSSLGPVQGEDRHSAKYLAKRYDPELPVAPKLLALLIEGELTTAHLLLPLTAVGHLEAGFRARFVSVFHSLSTLQAILTSHASARSTTTVRVLSVLETAPARWMLTDRGARRLRNQCVHCAIRGKDVRIDWTAPMFGLVPALTDGRSFEEVDDDLKEVAGHLADAVHDWSVVPPRS